MRFWLAGYLLLLTSDDWRKLLVAKGYKKFTNFRGNHKKQVVKYCQAIKKPGKGGCR